MKVPDLLRSDFVTYFGDMADNRMVDSPDGPWAQRMRDYANAEELNPEQLKEVLGRCAGTILLNRGVIERQQRLSHERATLVGLVLLSGKFDAVGEADRLMDERAADYALPPHVESALFISDVLSMLAEAQPRPA